jgi:hypothetical protein
MTTAAATAGVVMDASAAGGMLPPKEEPVKVEKMEG